MNDFLQSLRNGQAEKQRAPKTRKSYDNSYHYTSSPRFHSYGGYQNTRNPNMNRKPMPQSGPPVGNQMPAEDPGLTMLADAIENLTHHVETLVKNQEYMAAIQERTADMLERQAVAIERIVNHLNIAPFEETETESDPVFENHYVTSREPEPVAEEPVVAPEPEMIEEEAPVAMEAAPVAEEPKPRRRVVRKRKRIVAQEPVATSSVSSASSVSGNAPLLPREEIMDIINTMREQGATYDQVAKHLIELGQPTFSGRGEWHAQTIHRLCSKK